MGNQDHISLYPSHTHAGLRKLYLGGIGSRVVIKAELLTFRLLSQQPTGSLFCPDVSTTQYSDNFNVETLGTSKYRDVPVNLHFNPASGKIYIFLQVRNQSANNELEHVDTEKYLGVTIDEKL